ncbi:DNA uptake protein ComE [Chitinophaga costaii]|uniref:DNA uptake protein ComE n=1 Tax=Chitinophaga costaii TaxID=1335309 RepID=A0A1C4F2X3_9BACT|nr:helix-hairpin-helix domain-containing protein [Chitinophaga costaii]PUZ22113.1 helix-hairpin-helix domain-containing protein [Chitinophaga costaii]SCC50204.1 DNA uptake protein ComE [Chitinophaga costaii]
MWKQFIKHYLDFSQRERQGIYLLLGIIVCCCVLPHLLPAPAAPDIVAETVFTNTAAAISSPATNQGSPPPLPTLFYFDPNTLPLEGWLSLGVREKTAHTILHYREKGGHFRHREDLAKIYGLSPAQCEALLPYVRISDTVSFASRAERRDARAFAPQPFPHDSAFVYKRKAFALTDINAADSLAWMQLPGIGPSFAGRIVRFRERLGGFYTVNQVAETYGLPDSTFNKIQPFLQLHETSLKKIDLNQADEKTLAAHPYIRFSLAKLIIRYRNSHGPFAQTADLRQLVVINDSVYQKIANYLTITPKP